MDQITNVFKTAKDWIATEVEISAMLATAGIGRSLLMLAIALATLCIVRRLDAMPATDGPADSSGRITPRSCL